MAPSRAPKGATVLVALVCIILVVLLAVILRRGAPPREFGHSRGAATGGASAGGPAGFPKPVEGGVVATKAESPHIVVDTLNLAHWLFSTAAAPIQMTTDTITATVASTAPKIKARYPGRVVYVVKDRDSAGNNSETRRALAAAANTHSVYIHAVEQYAADKPVAARSRRAARASPHSAKARAPPHSTKARAPSHSTKARDDMYMAILAKRNRCRVLTKDKFRDFDSFRHQVAPFVVYGYSYWRPYPEMDYINPSNTDWQRLKKPPTIAYESLGLEPVAPPNQGKGAANVRNAELAVALGATRASPPPTGLEASASLA